MAGILNYEIQSGKVENFIPLRHRDIEIQYLPPWFEGIITPELYLSRTIFDKKTFSMNFYNHEIFFFFFWGARKKKIVFGNRHTHRPARWIPSTIEFHKFLAKAEGHVHQVILKLVKRTKFQSLVHA